MNKKELLQKISNAQQIIKEQENLIVNLQKQIAKINVESELKIIDKIIEVVNTEKILSEDYTKNHQRIKKEVNRSYARYSGGSAAKEKAKSESFKSSFSYWLENSGYNAKKKELNSLINQYAGCLSSDSMSLLAEKQIYIRKSYENIYYI